MYRLNLVAQIHNLELVVRDLTYSMVNYYQIVFVAFGPHLEHTAPLIISECRCWKVAAIVVSTCDAGIDTQVSCYEGNATTGPFSYNDDNGPICGNTRASVTFTPTFTDYTRVDVREYNCSPGGSQSITVSVRQNNNLVINSSSANMCQGQTRSLTATPAPVGATPQPNSGDTGTFSGTGVSGSTFTAPTPAGASQTFTITYTFGYCNTTQDITVYKNPSSASAGGDQTVCASSATLGANTPANGTGTWSTVSGTGTAISPNSPTSTVAGLTAGQTSIFRWTVSNGPCTVSTDDVSITRDPDPTTANAGPDQTICSTTTTLSGNTPSTGTGTWALVGGSGAIQAGEQNNWNASVHGLGIGQNTFRWTITNGVCTPSTDDVVITVHANPTVANAGPDQTVCGSTAILAGNTPSVGTGSWSVVLGSASVTNPNDPTSTVTGLTSMGTILSWTVSNGVCPVSSDSVMIIVQEPPLAFLSGTINDLTVSLSDASSSATSWWWDFGDGNSDTLENPVHTYASPGTYTICLIASNACGADTTCATATVCNELLADWTYTTNDIIADFTSTSTGEPTAWLWDFGDGNTSTQENPSHTYASPGTYTVCLTASNACETDSTCGTVTITCPVPTADWVHTATDLNAAFFADTTGNPTNWLWDFGDGNTSTQENPIHTYAASGTYTVCLTATNACGSDSICGSVSIICPLPSANWSEFISDLNV